MMVELVKPQAGEIVSDPAAGTLGFITRADAYIKSKTDVFDLPEAEQVFQASFVVIHGELHCIEVLFEKPEPRSTFDQ